MEQIKDTPCWLCGHTGLAVVKASDIQSTGLTSADFAITDAGYGATGEVHQCPGCGFMQCTDLNDVVSFYEGLEDQTYEEGRDARALQARKLLSLVARFRPGGRLLDVGAGSGILVEEAVAAGYDAEGVEPSRWLSAQATQRGLRVHTGTLPLPDREKRFDVVTLIDVIEHVSNPLEVLQQVHDVLAPGGIGLVVTPDRGSLMARIMGWRWWHYRIAHIGYFTKALLLQALQRTGLEAVDVSRPGWYFSAAYLAERLNVYLPRFVQIPHWSVLEGVTVPLNLGDSVLAVFRRADEQ